MKQSPDAKQLLAALEDHSDAGNLEPFRKVLLHADPGELVKCLRSISTKERTLPWMLVLKRLVAAALDRPCDYDNVGLVEHVLWPCGILFTQLDWNQVLLQPVEFSELVQCLCELPEELHVFIGSILEQAAESYANFVGQPALTPVHCALVYCCRDALGYKALPHLDQILAWDKRFSYRAVDFWRFFHFGAQILWKRNLFEQAWLLSSCAIALPMDAEPITRSYCVHKLLQLIVHGKDHGFPRAADAINLRGQCRQIEEFEHLFQSRNAGAAQLIWNYADAERKAFELLDVWPLVEAAVRSYHVHYIRSLQRGVVRAEWDSVKLDDSQSLVDLLRAGLDNAVTMELIKPTEPPRVVVETRPRDHTPQLYYLLDKMVQLSKETSELDAVAFGTDTNDEVRL